MSNTWKITSTISVNEKHFKVLSVIFTNYFNFDVDKGEFKIQYHQVPGIYIFTSISGYMATSASSDELDFMVKEIEKGVFACTECGKSSKCKRDLKRHIASKHMEGEPVR